MRGGVRIAGLVFLLTWIPLSLWRGISLGRSFRIGAGGQASLTPLVEGVIQMAFVTLAPALLVALLVFALWAWRAERRAGIR